MKTTEQKIEELEKQLQELKNENGKDLDAEKCEIIDCRWRAEKDELYFYISGGFEVCSCYDDFDQYDDRAYEQGNYFKTRELAEAAAEKVKELLLTLKHS